MGLKVEPSGQACGAQVSGVDLSRPLGAELIAEIRAIWLKHHVLAFPDQAIGDDDLERFTLAFGGFGHDPFFAPIPGRNHIAAIRREADEQSPLFAENWHTDWSFQARPPSGTCLMAVDIPPHGGDTLAAQASNAASGSTGPPLVASATMEARRNAQPAALLCRPSKRRSSASPSNASRSASVRMREARLGL